MNRCVCLWSVQYVVCVCWCVCARGEPVCTLVYCRRYHRCVVWAREVYSLSSEQRNGDLRTNRKQKGPKEGPAVTENKDCLHSGQILLLRMLFAVRLLSFRLLIVLWSCVGGHTSTCMQAHAGDVIKSPTSGFICHITAGVYRLAQK